MNEFMRLRAAVGPPDTKQKGTGRQAIFRFRKKET